MKKILTIIFGFLFLYGLLIFAALYSRSSLNRNELSDAQKYAVAQGFPSDIVDVIPFFPKVHVNFSHDRSLKFEHGGSGVLVRTNTATGHSRVFTAAHLFSDYEKKLCSKELLIKLIFEKKEFSGHLIYYDSDEDKDIAVVEFSPSDELRGKGVFIAEEDPQIGDDLFVFGYVHAEQGVILRVPFVHEYLEPGDSIPKFLLRESIVHGFSGGPVLNQSGELVGTSVEVFSRGPFSLAVERKFLEEASKEIDQGKKICQQ